MNVRLALGSALAFALAIVAGRVLFDSREQQVAEPAIERVVPVVQKKREDRSFVVGADGKPVKYGYTGWNSVDGGVKNENARMTHFVSSIYTEGAVHSVPAHKGAAVQWTPTQMEVRMGGQIASVLGKAGPVKGAVEETPDATLMTFNHTYPDTHEKMFIRPDGGMEHDILLVKQPEALDIGMDLAYSGRLNLSKGLKVFQGKTPITAHFRTMDALHFKDSNGNTVLELRAPYAWDAKITLPDGGMDHEKHGTKEHARRAVRCEYQLDFNDDGISLAVITSGRWLREEGRAYPVTIDPNFGPFLLNDDSPPFYTAQLGSDSVLPAYTATPILTAASAGGCNRSANDRAATIALPFDFNFYGVTFPAGTDLSIYENGYANFQPIIPCQSVIPPYAAGGCNDEENYALGTNGNDDGGPCTGPAAVKDFTFYPYWDNLLIPGDQDSGVYFFVDGDPATGNQRLVIEWHKMGFVGGDNNARISFNLILFQCESKFSFIIGQVGEIDNRSSTVGVRETLRPSGGRYVQYEFKQGIIGPNDNPNDVIPLGTSLSFSQSALPIFAVTAASGQEGCIPFTVCFDVDVTTPPRDPCVRGEPRSNAISYLWTWDDNTFSYQGPNPSTTEGATVSQRICHTYVTQDITNPNGSQQKRGTFNVSLTISNEFGAKSTVGPFLIRVCDPPEIIITGTPQGGYTPLDVTLSANAIGVSSTTYNLAAVPPRWRIFQLSSADPSGVGTLIATVDDTLASGNRGLSRIDYRFTQPGIYRAEIAYNFTDTLAQLTSNFTPPAVPPSTGEVFIFVSDPTDIIPDAMIITESKISVNWTDKVDGPDADGLPPNLNSAVPGEGLPDRPFNDTLTMKGIMNMPGVTLSSLVGKPVRIVLNTGTIIFNGLLNADGTAVDGDPSIGRTGTFKLSLPSGQFSLNVRGSLARIYGLTQLPDTTPFNRPGLVGTPGFVKRLLPVGYRIDIPTVFPPAGFDHSIVTYDYRSAAFQVGPPAVGNAEGFYKFGAFTSNKPVSLPNTDGQTNTPPESGKPGGQTLLVSGAFIVTDSKITLKGNLATVDAKGYLSRFGGDDLRPRDDSDVVFSLGTYSEALNFTTTGGFKAKGKEPSQLFTFKRPKTLGKTGVASLQWKNRAGLFQIKTNGLPIDKIGLNPAVASQTLVLGLQITPESTQQYIGTSRFEVFKTSATQFQRNAKIKQ